MSTDRIERHRNRYPGYSDEAYAEMTKRHSGPLGQEKKLQALKLYAEGLTREEICKSLKCSNATLQITRQFDEEFKRQWTATTTRRVKQVDDKLVESCLRGTVEVRITHLPKLDADRSPIYDAEGKQVFYIAKKEVIRRPPSGDLMQFFLKNLDPKFGAKVDDGGSNKLPIEEVKEAIRAKLKVVS